MPANVCSRGGVLVIEALLTSCEAADAVHAYARKYIVADYYSIASRTAARNALKRKKQHEHSLEQTAGQIQMLEQQIYSIESANINQETLAAMKNAGTAMKQIHGKMTMEDVDNTMLVFLRYLPYLVCSGLRAIYPHLGFVTLTAWPMVANNESSIQ